MNNEDLFSQAREILVGGVNSPVRSFSNVGGSPIFVERGLGPIISDAEGKDYIDYVGSFGPAILGHANRDVVETVQKQVSNGFGFGAPSILENELAQLIIDLVPSIEKVRMTSSGTEAALTAIRLARGCTERELIIKFDGCYHGHVDSLLVNAGSGVLTFGLAASQGIPQSVVSETLALPYNDTNLLVEAFEKYGSKVAAVIVEPIAGNMGCVLPKEEFLHSLREQTSKYGSLLIFDEVMTGFRVAPGGAQEKLGIAPDLTLLGKVIGGGLPVGAVGGASEIMNNLAPVGSVYQAGTLSGNPISMASGIATLKQLKEHRKYQRLEKTTGDLCAGLEKIASEFDIPLVTNHTCGMFGLFFTEAKTVYSLSEVNGCNLDVFKKFFHLMLNQGINLAPSPFEAGFLSFTHDNHHIEKTLEAARSAFSAIQV
tara:strand:- start:258 stop:1541 length:1284 start_codon:yes stop_codon:yes gene_type:complete